MKTKEHQIQILKKALEFYTHGNHFKEMPDDAEKNYIELIDRGEVANRALVQAFSEGEDDYQKCIKCDNYIPSKLLAGGRCSEGDPNQVIFADDYCRINTLVGEMSVPAFKEKKED